MDLNPFHADFLRPKKMGKLSQKATELWIAKEIGSNRTMIYLGLVLITCSCLGIEYSWLWLGFGLSCGFLIYSILLRRFNRDLYVTIYDGLLETEATEEES